MRGEQNNNGENIGATPMAPLIIQRWYSREIYPGLKSRWEEVQLSVRGLAITRADEGIPTTAFHHVEGEYFSQRRGEFMMRVGMGLFAERPEDLDDFIAAAVRQKDSSVSVYERIEPYVEQYVVEMLEVAPKRGLVGYQIDRPTETIPVDLVARSINDVGLGGTRETYSRVARHQSLGMDSAARVFANAQE